MNICIVLEDITIDTKFKKASLLSILEEYPLFKETSLDKAQYLIIIPNYPTSGKQNFSTELYNIVVNSSYNIDIENLYLLDSDNTLLKFDVKKSLDCEIWFKDENTTISDVFGFTPKQIAEATNYIKFGKHSKKDKELAEEAIQMEMDNFFNPPHLSIKKDSNLEARKKLLL